MAVISTGLARKGIRSEFLNRFDAAQRATVYQDWTTRITSDAEGENYRWLGTVPEMREWGDGRQAKGLRSESYNVFNKKYEATIEVDRDELSDDQTGQIRVRIGELAVRAATHKDKLLSTLLENGGTTGNNSYDGVTFFNDAHVSGASGSQDNDRTQNITDPTTPTTAEAKASIAEAVSAMMGFKDDQGTPMMLNTASLVCVVPPLMQFAFREALNAAIISQTSNVAMQGLAGVVTFPWLTSTDKWYLLKTDGVVRPFVFQDREPIEFTALDTPDSEEGFKREKYLYGCRARYALAYGYWQYAIRTTFT